MTIALSCPCGKNISVKDEAAGKQVRCPACGKALRIPSEEAAENVAASSVRGKPATPARPSRARTGLIVGAVAAIVLLGAFLIIHFSASGPSANSRGHLDTADLKNISGWAWDPDHPNRPLKVEIYDGDRLLTTVIADQFRKDLQAIALEPASTRSSTKRRLLCRTGKTT